MKRTYIIDVPCRGCNEFDVKHHANGYCNNCYHKGVLKTKASESEKAVDETLDKDTTLW